jgi:hypothetical protein
MSNTLAIGAVTAALCRLLDQVSAPLTGAGDPNPDGTLGDATCTARTPDRARDATVTANQLNLFLYATAPNAAMRNMPMPGRGVDGDIAAPPLALDLFYLLSVYGANGDEVLSHRLLGRAMAILHSHAVLTRSDLLAIGGAVSGNDFARQIECARITPHPLTTEEMSKLWTMFQTPYRVSAAYAVSVVLIDDTRPNVTPIPVLVRGRTSRPNSPWSGPEVASSLVADSPQLDGLSIDEPNPTAPPPRVAKPSARIGTGSVLTLTGSSLAGASVTARFTTAARPGVVLTLTPMAGATDTQVQLALPNMPAAWPAGFYSVALTISKPGDPDRQSNALGFTLSPRITSITPNPAARDGAGIVTLTVGCVPDVLPEQRTSLLVGDVETLAPAHGQVSSLTFVVSGVAASPPTRWVRLRVDGVDSLIVADYTITPPRFDPSQGIDVT